MLPRAVDLAALAIGSQQPHSEGRLQTAAHRQNAFDPRNDERCLIGGGEAVE
jgi:hypothetical protein